MGKNIVERGRPQMTIWRMRIACWIPKATNTLLEYAVFIDFPLTQCLQKGHLIVIYYVHWLV